MNEVWHEMQQWNEVTVTVQVDVPVPYGLRILVHAMEWGDEGPIEIPGMQFLGRALQEAGRNYELVWKYFCSVRQTNDVLVPLISDSVFEGNQVRVYEESEFLKDFGKRLRGVDNPLHYQILGMNYIVDVIAESHPEMRIVF
jgi:hypothetical protein